MNEIRTAGQGSVSVIKKSIHCRSDSAVQTRQRLLECTCGFADVYCNHCISISTCDLDVALAGVGVREPPSEGLCLFFFF